MIKHDHDQVKGNKITFFCADELVSNSELSCSVDYCHFTAMLEVENIGEGLSNPSILNMHVKNDFRLIHDNQWNRILL